MRTLTPNETRTIVIVGKPYHWTLNEAGRLSLLPGPAPGSPEDIEQQEVLESIKGVLVAEADGQVRTVLDQTGEAVHATVIKADQS